MEALITALAAWLSTQAMKYLKRGLAIVNDLPSRWKAVVVALVSALLGMGIEAVEWIQMPANPFEWTQAGMKATIVAVLSQLMHALGLSFDKKSK